MEEMGSRLKQIRKAAGLSQADLANLAGLSKDSIGRYERNERDVRMNDLQKIAEALGTTQGYLLGETSTPTPPKWSQGPSAESGESMIKHPGGGIPESIPYRPEFFNQEDMISIPIYEDACAACAGRGNHLEGVEPTIAEWRKVDSRDLGPISEDPEMQPFGIKVDGDSMAEAGIPDGSFAIVNPAAEFANGAPVLVRTGSICAIKWVECRPGGTLVFYSASGTYPVRSFTVEEQEEMGVRVLGVVTGALLKPKWMK